MDLLEEYERIIGSEVLRVRNAWYRPVSEAELEYYGWWLRDRTFITNEYGKVYVQVAEGSRWIY